MKLSAYNNRIFFEGQSYIYNSFSDKFLALDSTVDSMFEVLRSNTDIENISKIHPSFFQSLVKHGFVLDDEIDELANVKLLANSVDQDETRFHLTINPTMNCNFKCWYCYESHEKGSKMTNDMVANICRYVDELLKTKTKLKKLNVEWFGGEPLLYYFDVIKPITMHIMKTCSVFGIEVSFGFTTNGSLITDDIIRDIRHYPISSFQITLDGSKEFHDTVRFLNAKRGSYDCIFQNIKKLCSNNIFVLIRVNYTNKNLKDFEKTFNNLLQIDKDKWRFVSIDFHKVWQEKESDETLLRVRSIVKTLKRIGFRSNVGAIPDNVRNSCYADKPNSAVINYNGNVYKCTARNFSSDNREGVLGASGIIKWNSKHDDRVTVKFKNTPCLKCSILPLCNGGCSQHAIENLGKDYCVYDFDEKAKKEIVINKLIAVLDYK